MLKCNIAKSPRASKMSTRYVKLKKKEKGKKSENTMRWGKKKKNKDNKYFNMKRTESKKKGKKNILK